MTSSSLYRSLVRLGALCLLVTLARPESLSAQSASHGLLSGVVEDGSGRPVSDAEVRIVDRSSGAARRVSTGRDGAFRFGLLNPSLYDVMVEALGFRPVVHLGVSVGAGASPTIRVALRRATPPVVAVDTVRAMGARAAPLAWMQARGYSELVGGRRLASDAALLSPVADEDAVEGLPWRFADLMVDGARLGAAGAPGATGSATTALAMPARGIAGVTVGGLGFDVEVGGAGVGLSALSLRGGGASRTSSAIFGGTSDIGGGAVFGGPIQRDTADAIIGVDYQRSEVTRPAWFLADDAAGLALVNVARDSFSTDLSGYRGESSRLEERASAFGRLDWQLGDRYSISMRAAGSRLVAADPPLLTGTAGGFGSRHEATAAQVSVDIVARLTRRITSELRVSGDVAEATADRPAIAPTAFAGRGVGIGGATDEPFSDQRAAPRVSGMLHWDVGAHRVKLGGVIASGRFESQGMTSGLGEFRFGDAADFSAGTGAWRGLGPTTGSGSFRMSERAFFVQDSWAVTSGLALTFGVRFDGNTLPVGEIDRNAAWLARTGIDNASVRGVRSRVAPRIGFRWELGSAREWVFEGGAGVYNDLPDRRDVAEALTLDQGVDVRSAVGALGGWPGVPDSVVAPVRGRTLSIIGPGYEGPRTRRMTLGLQRDIGIWTAYVKGTYRQTDFLARHRDLNLPVNASGADQFGRPLFGALQQVGTLVVATPGSNRRFSEFDAVNAIEVTGFSEFWAATVGVERVVERGLTVGLHYTYSRTTDNLAGGRDALAPLTAGASGVEWSDGTADTDAPHRVIAAMEWSPAASGAVRLGMVYRLRSGAPFTPGFRDGVDANGDGVWGNDPAFVDLAFPGLAALAADNACLRRASGTYAERNDCRGELTHRLDLRAAFRIMMLGAGPLDLVVDAMDVIPGTSGRVDRALYLVDRTGALTRNTTTGVTTVPLVVNPNFGALLADRAPGMLFRVGLRIGR